MGDEFCESFNITASFDIAGATVLTGVPQLLQLNGNNITVPPLKNKSADYIRISDITCSIGATNTYIGIIWISSDIVGSADKTLFSIAANAAASLINRASEIKINTDGITFMPGLNFYIQPSIPANLIINGRLSFKVELYKKRHYE